MSAFAKPIFYADLSSCSNCKVRPYVYRRSCAAVMIHCKGCGASVTADDWNFGAKAWNDLNAAIKASLEVALVD